MVEAAGFSKEDRMTTSKTKKRPAKGTPLHPRTRAYWSEIKKHVTDPRYATAVSWGAAALAIAEDDPSPERLAEARLWLVALGMTPVENVHVSPRIACKGRA